MTRFHAIMLGACAVLVWAFSGADPDLGVAAPWLFAAVALRIEFLGLVDLVSDGDAAPDGANVLMPNATDPRAGWIPEVLQFDTQHFPRLLVRSGTVDASSEVGAVPSPHPADDGLQMVDLNGQHVTIASALTPAQLEVNRMSPGNPNEGHLSTVNYLADMDQLAGMAVPPLGPVSPGLLADPYVGDPPRISARLALESGRLTTGDLWRKPGQSYEEIDFPQIPGETVPMYRRFLASSLLFTADTVLPVTLHLRALGQAQGARALRLLPEGGVVDLVIKNAEHSYDEQEPHFIAHYLVRDGFAQVEKVRLPDPSCAVGGAGSDPQCSPADNGGG